MKLMIPCRLAAVIFIVAVVEAHAAQSRSIPDSLRHRIEHLPLKLTELYRAKEMDLAGSTMSMTKALVSISDELLDDAVVLQVFVTGQSPENVRAEIRRDREALARSVDYERNAEGWGGTITGIEASATGLTHVENLISFYVTRIFDNDHLFKLKNWHVEWGKASKQNKE